jgi:hypothetical protein
MDRNLQATFNVIELPRRPTTEQSIEQQTLALAELRQTIQMLIGIYEKRRAQLIERALGTALPDIETVRRPSTDHLPRPL